MYKIKQIPEDFVVKEIFDIGNRIKNKGRFTYWKLIKRNYTTMRAVQIIAEKLNIDAKKISFAGNKDRKAVTEQNISIIADKNKAGKLRVKDIELEFLGCGDEPISLGEHKGNKFEITLRDFSNKPKMKCIALFPNFFGEQRFSMNNAEIGKLIVKNNFKKALELLRNKSVDKDLLVKINEFWSKQTSNYIGALRLIPRKLLRLYVHSYQSYLWNKAAEGLFGKAKKNIELPVIGFSTEFENKSIKKVYDKILSEEKISTRDFIIKQMPELSSSGTFRSLFAKIYYLKILNISKDELNKGKYKIKISFKLDKGCYATTALKYLFPYAGKKKYQ